MTIRKTKKQNIKSIKESNAIKRIGTIIKQHRLELTDIAKTREKFVYADHVGLDPDWISVKSLANIENGKNLPSILTLFKLATALQVDARDLFREVADAIIDPSKSKNNKLSNQN